MNNTELKVSIMKKLRDYAFRSGKTVNDDYFTIPEDNLVDNFRDWEQIKEELSKGSGKELCPSDKDGKISFCALRSSAALCVNSFALMKENTREIAFLDITHFTQARFEFQLSTGLRGFHPNLDFYLENSSNVIGVESKFLEILDPKPQDLNAYIRSDNVKILQSYLPDSFLENVIQFYQKKKDKYPFDFSQIIKHTIGLIRHAQFEKKKPILLYIYWTPEDDQVTPQIYMQHSLELKEFQSRVKDYIDFRVMNYETLWSDVHIAKSYGKALTKITDKYRITI